MIHTVPIKQPCLMSEGHTDAGLLAMHEYDHNGACPRVRVIKLYVNTLIISIAKLMKT